MKTGKWLFATVLLLAGLVLPLGGEVALADLDDPPPIAITAQPLVRFQGVVSSRPEGTNIGTWVIADRSVRVVETTRIDEEQGPAEVGVHVSVIAKRPDVNDTSEVELEAILIRVLPPVASIRPIIIRGRVTELETTYLVVNELKILYDRSTHIEGYLEVGAFVKIRAIHTSAGLKALTITVLPVDDKIIEFGGVIEYIGHPAWVIDGRKVKVTRQTRIFGRPRVGLYAKVRAVVESNGELLALTIHVQNEWPHKVEWTGIIEQLPPQVSTEVSDGYVGRWVVGGRTVLVTRRTEIVGTPRVGLTAHVVALRYPRRPLVAMKIEVLNLTPAETAP